MRDVQSIKYLMLVTLTGGAMAGSATELSSAKHGVVNETFLSVVLDADIENKILGQPIGTGGASVGEPETIQNTLETEVIEAGLDNQALLITNPNGIAYTVTWGFLHDIEYSTGQLTVAMDVDFPSVDHYALTFGRISDSGVFYSSLSFGLTGSIGISDSNGFAGFVGSYVENQWYRLKMVFDMDTGLYDVYLDDAELLTDRAHELYLESGTGIIQTGFQSTSSEGSSLIVDNLHAQGQISDLIFKAGFEPNVGQ